MSKAEILGRAGDMYLGWEKSPKSKRQEAVLDLFTYGLSAYHIAQLTNMKLLTVIKWLGITVRQANAQGERGSGPLNPRHILDLWVIAKTWESSGLFNVTIARMLVKNGTSIANISYLTGIEINYIREALREGE